jgi:hypothetical protein
MGTIWKPSPAVRPKAESQQRQSKKAETFLANAPRCNHPPAASAIAGIFIRITQKRWILAFAISRLLPHCEGDDLRSFECKKCNRSTSGSFEV